MRRSQAPSLRGVLPARFQNKSNLHASTNKGQSTIRSTENVLQLILKDDQTTNVLEPSAPILPSSSSVLRDNRVIPPPSHHEQSKIFTIMYAKPSNKKHKTWEGDGLLYVYDGYCIAKDEQARKIGSIKISKNQKIEEGTHLFIGDKEIEVSDAISAEEAHSQLSPMTVLAVPKENKKPITSVAKLNSHDSSSSLGTEATCQNTMSAEVIFSIMYAKPSTRKHKVWEGDGTLYVGDKFATAKDESGKVFGTYKLSNSKKLEEGTRLVVGSKEIELLEQISSEELLKRKADSGALDTMPEPKKPKPLLLSNNFVCPRLGAVQKNFNLHLQEDAFLLPDPTDDSQWQFRDGASITPVSVEPFLARKLRQHQKKGVTFLYECIMGFRDNSISGAILADEMGLGKTLQCIALIWTLLRQGPYGKPVAREVLIVTPSSLTGNWAAEIRKWLGDTRIVPYVIDAKHKPQDRSPHQKVVIVSYEMLLRHFETIGTNFDLLICDEAHRLKNADTKVSRALNELCISKRILLTGTPIQNDMLEFYALADFTNPNCLGSYSAFKRQYEEPILASRQPQVTEEVREIGEERVMELNQLTGVFILRRTQSVLDGYLPGKQEIVLFCRPSSVQQSAYNSVLESLDPCGYGSDGSSHLGVISALRKVANHPALLKMEDLETSSTDDKEEQGEASIEDSGKLMLVVGLLAQLWSTSPRERIVFVSAFTQTLDMMEEVCQMHDYPTLRLDGTTQSAQRTDIVSRFNSDSSQFVFLLSAKAGGVGLNLVGASRLVLFDSDWNPATDLQAMGRIWREGQRRQVYIYRLLTTGTIEEKIFQRQLSKQTLAGGIVDSVSVNSVMLCRDDLKDIFMPCVDVPGCLTHTSLGCECAGEGAVPVPLSAKDTRACQVEVGGAPAAAPRIEELMGWEHHAPPLSEHVINTLKLSESTDIVTYMFSTSC